MLASNSKDANGDFDDEYTGVSAVDSGTHSIDNNAVHYYDGLANAGITGGASITTIAVKNAKRCDVDGYIIADYSVVGGFTYRDW